METIQCAICVDRLFAEDHVVATSCQHVFHEKCIKTWLDKSNTCPECRQPCKAIDSRRLFFKSESNPHFVEKEVEYQNEIIQLKNQIQQHQEALQAEVQIRETMHAKLKKTEEELTALKNAQVATGNIQSEAAARMIPLTWNTFGCSEVLDLTMLPSTSWEVPVKREKVSNDLKRGLDNLKRGLAGGSSSTVDMDEIPEKRFKDAEDPSKP